MVERMNKTLNEHARSMRLHSGLPKNLWADVVSTVAYLINRGPSILKVQLVCKTLMNV